MNQAGVPGRLPPADLPQNESLPSPDMRGGVWDFESCTDYVKSSGAEICIPWVIAATPPASASPITTATPGTTRRNSAGYEFGVLWNMPNFGSMALAHDSVEWVANDPVNGQIDIFVTTHAGGDVAGTTTAAKQIMASYVDATGHSPVMFVAFDMTVHL